MNRTLKRIITPGGHNLRVRQLRWCWTFVIDFRLKGKHSYQWYGCVEYQTEKEAVDTMTRYAVTFDADVREWQRNNEADKEIAAMEGRRH